MSKVLTDWHVSVAMVRLPTGVTGPRVRRTFTTILPAATEAYALLGAHHYGVSVSLGSQRAWRFDGDGCVSAEPIASTEGVAA